MTTCVGCGAKPIIVYRTLDGEPRCHTCHVRAVEKAKRDRLR